MAEIDDTPVVIDNGSGSIKVGMSGHLQPRASFPTIVGRPRNFDQAKAPQCIGMDAILEMQRPHRSLNVSDVIQHGT